MTKRPDMDGPSALQDDDRRNCLGVEEEQIARQCGHNWPRIAVLRQEQGDG